jgi:hypothetical protein
MVAVACFQSFASLSTRHAVTGNFRILVRNFSDDGPPASGAAVTGTHGEIPRLVATATRLELRLISEARLISRAPLTVASGALACVDAGRPHSRIPGCQRTLRHSSRAPGRIRARRRGKRKPLLALIRCGLAVYCGNYVYGKPPADRSDRFRKRFEANVSCRTRPR